MWAEGAAVMPSPTSPLSLPCCVRLNILSRVPLLPALSCPPECLIACRRRSSRTENREPAQPWPVAPDIRQGPPGVVETQSPNLALDPPPRSTYAADTAPDTRIMMARILGTRNRKSMMARPASSSSMWAGEA